MSATITPDVVFSPTGTSGADTIELAFSNGFATITGLADGTEVVSAAAGDHLTISALGGDDVIRAQNGFPAGLVLTLDGGSGNDTITGSDLGDTLIGGTGNDVVIGGRGNDVASLGTGNDKFIWNPGDGSDTVEGDGGTDTLQFNGSNIGENIDIAANGSRVLLTRDVAAITMDLNGMEVLNVATLGGADHVTLGDLAGTGVKQVNVNLAGFDGSPDGSTDIVSVLGTDKSETVSFTSNGADTMVKGLALQTVISNAESIDTVNVQAGAGSDTFDLSNLSGVVPTLALDGGDGMDTVIIKGSSAGDQMSLVNNGSQILALVRDGVVEGNFSVNNVESILLQGQGGDDTLTASNGFPTGTTLTIDGGAGNDHITGGDQADILIGGAGNDLVAGGRGNDNASLGSGNDTFVWNPGDGSDTVEGGSGTDTLQFNASNIGENIDIFANGGHAVLTRNVAAITMDLNGMEVLNVATLGGTDHVSIADLSGTGVDRVNVDLGQSGGGGDGAADTVSVLASGSDDIVKFSSNGVETVVSGISADLHVTNAESTDVINVQAGLGNDTFDLSNLAGPGLTFALDGGEGIDTALIKGSSAGDEFGLSAGGGGSIAVEHNGVFVGTLALSNVENLLLQGQGGDDNLTVGNGFPAGVALTLDGGGGNDTLVGGDQADTLLGGSGDDIVRGGRGDDIARLGSGNDTFVWNPGDGSDSVDGQGGSDTLQFNGSNVGENISISADAGHVDLLRNVANISMDLDGVETINVATLGSADNVTIGDLSGTDAKRVNIDLGSFVGSGDGAADTVSADGTDHNDNIQLTTSGTGVSVSGLHPQVFVDHGETIDTLAIHGGLGNDRIDASRVAAGGMTLVLDGGAGSDVLTGSAGHDVFLNGETVLGFDSTQDQLDLRGVASGQTGDWVLAQAHDEHGNVVFDFGTSQITLVGESVTQLHVSDFILT